MTTLTDFARALHERVDAEGAIGVDDYMAACNAYYYATRDPLGAGGDFTTAPEISQMFGEVVGAALADIWLRAGAPSGALFAELGPGRGTLAADALRVLRSGGFAGEVHFVETSPTLRAAQARLVPEAIWHERIEDLPGQPILLAANEFFDALPVKQFIADEERRVTLAEGQLAFSHDGDVRETSPARQAAMAALAKHLDLYGGAALIIDYGHRHAATGDTLQAVSGHAFADPLARPGEQDLTAHVDFEALAKSAHPAAVSPLVTQGTWLERLGMGARAMALAAKTPVRTGEIAAARRRLCDSSEMGELFKVLAVHARNWPEPAGFCA